MKAAPASWPLSSILLLLFGLILIVIGVYFAVLRPPLLPEDLRYIGASQQELEAAAPRLTVWLAQVFRAMGGYVAATGVLTVTIAATAFRVHWRGGGAGGPTRGPWAVGGVETRELIDKSR